jgi:ribosomal protein L37AE/L43A
MKLLLTKPYKLTVHLIAGNGKRYLSKSLNHSHTCPCCSYPLLSHIRLGGQYWRCSHCYQEMPFEQP